MKIPSLRQLHQLANLYHVQTSYTDVFGRRRQSSADGLMRVLRTLGAPLERADDIPGALRESRESLGRRWIDEVLVAWNGRLRGIDLRLPPGLDESSIGYEVRLESGERLDGSCRADLLMRIDGKETEGTQHTIRKLSVPNKLPYGYHRLRVEIAEKACDALILSAPRHAYFPDYGQRKAWGIFAPLYGLHSENSWGAGDFSDLARLVEWVKGLDGKVVATLPLLASFLRQPFEPSPYSPVSRLFWNEFYLDVSRIPELEKCAGADALMNSSSFQNDLKTLRSRSRVNYREQMALKRKVVDELASCLFSGDGTERQTALGRFVESNPSVEDYARFRATMERQQKPWSEWPQPSRDGSLESGDYGEDEKRYHLYAQWLAHEQLETLGGKTRKAGLGLYLDFPVGVHRDGYDVWRERAAFAVDVNGGAPPDSFFAKGQDWGFPPLHPEQLRRQGYRYFISCVRHHLKYANLLRIDHVMGLHRLFWIPQGFQPVDGVYVRYPAEELYAILCLESDRHQAGFVGENLGTVPSYVNASMARHKIRSMYIGQFSIRPDPETAVAEIPVEVVAGLNTHDTATFAGFWQGLDIKEGRELGQIDESGYRAEEQSLSSRKEALVTFLKNRGWLKESEDFRAVLRAFLGYLAASPAEIVMVNLEDLWLETSPQNIPGTRDERPNWRRKTRYRFEEYCNDEEILYTLREINRLRKQD